MLNDETRGEWWVVWFCTLGHRHREKVGPRGLARERHAARRREVGEARREGWEFSPSLEQRQRPVTFEDITQDYKKYSEATKRSHADDRPRMARLLRAFRLKLTRDITPQDVEAFKSELAKTRKVATVTHHLKLLKAIFDRAIKAGKLTYNPVRGVKLFKENSPDLVPHLRGRGPAVRPSSRPNQASRYGGPPYGDAARGSAQPAMG